MMGERRVMQEALFYGFSLERHVPDSHMLRRIDRFVDLSEVRAHLAPYYSDVGRPSIDPELMIRMLLVGYCFGIRSERRRPVGFHAHAGRIQRRLGAGHVGDHEIGQVRHRVGDALACCLAASAASRMARSRFAGSAICVFKFTSPIVACVEYSVLPASRSEMGMAAISGFFGRPPCCFR
jgi:hypothetical protein